HLEDGTHESGSSTPGSLRHVELAFPAPRLATFPDAAAQVSDPKAAAGPVAPPNRANLLPGSPDGGKKGGREGRPRRGPKRRRRPERAPNPHAAARRRLPRHERL